MKTVRQHLNTLPYPYNEMAIKETSYEMLKSKELKPEIALACAFVWSTSEMGIDFWVGIQDNIGYK